MKLLQKAIEPIRNPSKHGMIGNKVVEHVTMQNHYVFAATLKNILFNNFNSQQMGNHFRRPVMISVDPDDIGMFGYLPKQRQYLPVLFA